MSLSDLFLKELIMVQKIHRDLISGPNPVNLAQLYNNFVATNCAPLTRTNGTEIGQIGHEQQRQSPIGTNLASSSRQTQTWPNGLHRQQFRTDEKRMPNSSQASHVTASGVLAPINSLSHHHKNPSVQTNLPANKKDQNAEVKEQFEQQSTSNATQMPFELAQIVAKSDQQEKNGTILNRKTSNSMPQIEAKKVENLNQGAGNDQEIDEIDLFIDIETIDPFDQPEPSKRLFVDRIQPNWNDRRQCLNVINSESVGTSSSFERSIYESADNESASSSSFDHCGQNANGETEESAIMDKISTKIDHLDNDWEDFANWKKSGGIKVEMVENKQIENKSCKEQIWIKEEVSEFDQMVENDQNAKENEKIKSANDENENGAKENKKFNRNKKIVVQNIIRKCEWAECELKFENDNKLYDHLKTTHIDELIEKNKEKMDDNDLPNLKNTDDEEKFACKWKDCDLPARRRNTQRKIDWLLNHVFVCHLPKAETHVCVFFGCQMRFRRLTALNNHLHTVHSESIPPKKKGRKRKIKCPEFDETH